MQSSASPPPRRRRHIGTWIVVIFGLVELAALAGFIAFRDRACPIVAANRGAAGGSAGGMLALPAAGSGQDSGSNGPATASVPPPAPADSPAPSSAAEDPAQGAGSAQAQGDTNQVPDPNCVAKTTAGLLNSEPAASTSPSCAPMSPPPALKQAEQQVQAGATP